MLEIIIISFSNSSRIPVSVLITIICLLEVFSNIIKFRVQPHSNNAWWALPIAHSQLTNNLHLTKDLSSKCHPWGVGILSSSRIVWVEVHHIGISSNRLIITLKLILISNTWETLITKKISLMKNLVNSESITPIHQSMNNINQLEEHWITKMDAILERACPISKGFRLA